MSGNIYLFYGEEDYLMDEEIKKLTGTNALNVEFLDGVREPMDVIINSIASVPLLLGDKVVVITDPWFLKAQRARGARSEEEEKEEGEEGDGRRELRDEIDQLIPVLETLSGGVKVIFVVHGKADRRKKLYKVIEKLGEVREFKPFAEWEQEKLEAWIMKRVNASGKKIGGGAAETLMEISGRGLRALSSEIDKLVTYVGERSSIEEADVRELASSGEMSAFSLSGAVRDRDVHASLEALTRLLKDNEEPVSLIGLLASQFRMLLQVKSLKEQGLSDPQIASRLGANIYFVKRSSEKTHHYTLSELERNLKLLHAADLRIKTGAGSPPSILEMAVIEILEKEREDDLQGAGHKVKQ